jgi:hypothetical protein
MFFFEPALEPSADAPPISSAVLFLFLRQRRKMSAATKAMPARTPITIPAIAPAERPWSRSTEMLSLAPGAGTGVEVTVCVTTPPEIVVTIMLVTGVGVTEDCGLREETDDVELEVLVWGSRHVSKCQISSMAVTR